jgi:hypothetical protein
MIHAAESILYLCDRAGELIADNGIEALIDDGGNLAVHYLYPRPPVASEAV